LCERHIADIFGEIKTRTSSSDEDDEGSKYMHLGVFYNPTQETLQDGEDWTTKGEASNERERYVTNVTNASSSANSNNHMTNAMNASFSANPNYRNANTRSNNNKGKAPLIENSKSRNVTKRKREPNASTQNKQTKTFREWGIFLMQKPKGGIRNKETVKITVKIDGEEIYAFYGLYELKKNGNKKCWYPVETNSFYISNNDNTSYLETLNVENPDCIDKNYIVKFTTDYGVPRNSEIFKYVEEFVRIEEEKKKKDRRIEQGNKKKERRIRGN